MALKKKNDSYAVSDPTPAFEKSARYDRSVAAADDRRRRRAGSKQALQKIEEGKKRAQNAQKTGLGFR